MSDLVPPYKRSFYLISIHSHTTLYVLQYTYVHNAIVSVTMTMKWFGASYGCLLL